MKSNVTIAMGLLGLLALPSTAHAILVDRDICVWYHLDLVDADPNHGDDYIADNATSYRAGYARIRLYDDTAGTYETLFLPEGGCVTRTLDTAHDYHVNLHSTADVDGRRIQVRNEPLMNAEFAMAGPTFSPDSKGPSTLNVTFTAATNTKWVNVLAISAFTIHRRKLDWPVLLAGDAYRIYLTAHASGAALFDPEEEAIFLDPANGVTNPAARKFTIAHEMGHALQYWTNWWEMYDPAVPAYDPSCGPGISICAHTLQDYQAVDDSACGAGANTHGYNSKEFQSAAIVEGFAHYVAAVAFNSVGGATCRWVPNGAVDWNPLLGGTRDPFSCEGAEDLDPGGAEAGLGVDARDYMGDYCAAAITDNRGVEVDWLRFWWDVDQDQGVAFGDILSVWGLAGSWFWTPGPRDTGDTGYDQFDDPSVRIRDAFAAHGIANAWSAEQSNGVWR